MTARRTRHPWLVMLAFAAAIGGVPFHAQDRQEPREGSGDRKDKKELPLEPDRTIAFDTSEGSWISLDVAPDGRSIVFELLGDLYTLPIEGGNATRITSGLMFDSQPRYSPDGSKIVFLSDRSGDENIWIANRDGSDPQPLTKGKNTRYLSPEWTPGRQVHHRVQDGRSRRERSCGCITSTAAAASTSLAARNGAS